MVGRFVVFEARAWPLAPEKTAKRPHLEVSNKIFYTCSTMSLLTVLFGDPNRKVLRQLEPIVKQVNDLATRYSGFSDEELRNAFAQLEETLSIAAKGVDVYGTTCGWRDVGRHFTRGICRGS